MTDHIMTGLFMLKEIYDRIAYLTYEAYLFYSS